MLKRLLRERFYLDVYVVATELRRKMLATAAPYFSDVFSCRSRSKEIPTKQRQKGELEKMKPRIGTPDHLVAATCAQPAAGR